MKKRFSRTVLMISGILTVVVILASQSFYHPVKDASAKKTTAQHAKENGGAKITNAPSDVVPCTTVQLDENTPTLVKTSPAFEETEKTIPVAVTILASYFKTLFRTVISPNAP